MKLIIENMKNVLIKINNIIILIFTEKNNLAVLGSRFCKVNNIFYIGINKFIRTNPLFVIGEDEKKNDFVKPEKSFYLIEK